MGFKLRRERTGGSRTWFGKMLLSYLPAFFILTAFLFFIFFQILNSRNQDAARKTNDYVTRQAQLVVDASLTAIDQKITLEMLRNRTVLRYFSEPTAADLSLQVNVMNELAELKIANPLIHSIYMVRADDRMVLNMSTTYPLSRYPDAPFIESSLKSPNSKWSNLRLYKELPSETGTPVVTLTRSVSIFSGRYGLIVINVNAASLQQLVRDMYDASVTQLHLYDGSGQDLFHTDPSTAAPKANKTLASASVSDYTGWRLVSEWNDGKWITFLLSLFNVWLVLGLLVCALALGWIVWMTRQNYRPIRNLVAQLERYSPGSGAVKDGDERYGGEFRYIHSMMENMIDQNSRFQLQLQQDLEVKRNFYLYGLLEGIRQVGPEEWAATAEQHGMYPAFGKVFVVVLEIDRSAEWRRTYSQEEQDGWKKAVESIVGGLTEKADGCRVWMLWTMANQLAVMLMSEGDEPDEAMSALIGEWHARIRDDMPFEMTIGLGEPAVRPENIHDAYQEALAALQYKSIEGNNRILKHTGGPTGRGEVFRHLQRIDGIVDLLRLSDAKWRAEFRSLIRQMELDRASREDIGQVMNYLIFNLGRAVEGMSAEYRRLWSTDVMPALAKTLAEVEMMGDIAHAFFEALEAFEERVEQSRESRNQGVLIKEVKAFIESDFARPELSLDYLSEKFGISGKYLSRLFKEEFGLKFVDFLIDLRIRHAQQLLAETSLPVQEISERIGYSSPISFARTFKKIVGVPPIDYRKEKQG
ncbi:helix-turn-helix domain-containing protein [Cohnella hashimotonis]|uniref:Helix-turn-helix domain-containing protein n=1 Tax=Cohnella hashimotonis TaxID=2826895 RepID=A0ABT6TNP2_9BACL|nr:helix-turn-helix domain-containing protein [Cohnella hashimotonis]MDI4648166.1 helix-turn-helix domain-containing protein [Cohnella hashimotonis]